MKDSWNSEFKSAYKDEKLLFFEDFITTCSTNQLLISYETVKI